MMKSKIKQEYFPRKPKNPKKPKLLKKATPKLKRKNGSIAQRGKGTNWFSRSQHTKLPAKTY